MTDDIKKANWFTRLKPIRKIKKFWEHYLTKRAILKENFDVPCLVYWHSDKDFMTVVYRTRSIHEGGIMAHVVLKAIDKYVRESYARKLCSQCGREL